MLVGRLAGPLCSHIYNVGMITFSLYFTVLTFYLVEIPFNLNVLFLMNIIRRYIIHIFEIRADDMYTTIRNTALTMVACFSYIAHASTHPPLNITRGAGGDASGATVIHDNWRHGTPDPINLTDIPIDKIRPEKYSYVLIIGQGAIKEMLLANYASAILSGKTVGLYTHLIVQNTLRLLRQLQNKVRFNLFFTRSQVTLLKLRNISEYNFLSSKINNVWG